MSGGHFDHDQYRIQLIIESIEKELSKQGKLKNKEDLWMHKEYYDEHPEEKYYYTYPEDIQQIFKDGILVLKKAYIYAQRIDWFLSGDDGDDSLRERLAEELKELE